MKLYWSMKKLPDLSGVPEETYNRLWGRHIWRHWQMYWFYLGCLMLLTQSFWLPDLHGRLRITQWSAQITQLAVVLLVAASQVIAFRSLFVAISAAIAREVPHLCANCGYRLAGLHNPVCPQCGTPFDPAKLLPAAQERPLQRQEHAGQKSS